MTQRAIKVHLGSFDHIIPNWDNTDVTPHLFVARVPGLAGLMGNVGLMSSHRVRQHRDGIFKQLRYLNVGKRFPYQDNTAEAVYASHMLEHLLPNVGESCVKECFRILKPDGVLRLAVPDLDQLMLTYNRDNPKPFLETFFEIGSSSSKNRHWWHYNNSSLTGLLKLTGFREVYRSAYREGRCPDVGVIDTRPESLFVEGLK